MARRSEWRANVLAGLLALAVFIALIFGVSALFADEEPFQRDEIPGYCEESVAERMEPGSSRFRDRVSDCVWMMEADPFG